jgi:hypothetical protein
MPTVKRIGPYRFFFYSHEPNEPPHVHVDAGDCSAKFWIKPVRLARNMGYSAAELRKIHALVWDHSGELMEAWNGYFVTSRG